MEESSEPVEWMRPVGLVIGSYGSPLAATYLPLQDAMTVLYGLNGAGKSFVLDALRCSLTGIVSERLRNCTIWLLAELPEELDRWPVGLARAFESVTANPLAAYGPARGA